MGACKDCRLWLTMRVTDYEDGTRIANLQSPEGKGHCEVLKIETDSEFGCNRYEEGHEHIEIMAKKTGSPWHHSHRDACPECKKTPGMVDTSVCGRCCGTGQVLHYDDGFVGEEKTRRHPNEAVIGPPPAPTCPGCSRAIEITWVSCPWCGTKLPPAEKPIRTTEF
jgi:hypothetical protein